MAISFHQSAFHHDPWGRVEARVIFESSQRRAA